MRIWRRDLASQAKEPEQRQVERLGGGQRPKSRAGVERLEKPGCQVESHALVLMAMPCKRPLGPPVRQQGGVTCSGVCMHMCVCCRGGGN